MARSSLPRPVRRPQTGHSHTWTERSTVVPDYNENVPSLYAYPSSLSDAFRANTREWISSILRGIKRERLPYIHTFSGVQFKHGWPVPNDITIEDVAHSLSRLCRFTGHVKPSLYSVAEHAVRVSYACAPEDAKWGLHHDDSEAFCNDLSRPFKRMPGMEGYRHYEALITQCVRERFELEGDEPESVLAADLRMLATEKRDLFVQDCSWAVNKGEEGNPLPDKIEAWSQPEAETRFLMRHYELYGTNKFFEKYKDFELDNLS